MLPRETRLFAWADPTGTRKLTWSYASNVGEHDLLKVPFVVEVLSSWDKSELKCLQKDSFVLYIANNLYWLFF